MEWQQATAQSEYINEKHADVERLRTISGRHKELMEMLDQHRRTSQERELAQAAIELIKSRGSRLFAEGNNACSIVFHEVANGSGRILMTGDITRRVIRKYLIGQFSSHYRLLKAPHHGTEKHYSPALPLADYILISNAKCGRYGRISAYYIRHGTPTTQRFCSGGRGHCEGIALGIRCANGTCSGCLHSVHVT